MTTAQALALRPGDRVRLVGAPYSAAETGEVMAVSRFGDDVRIRWANGPYWTAAAFVERVR